MGTTTPGGRPASGNLGERAGMPPAVAQATHQLARVLARRTRPGDRDEAAALATDILAVDGDPLSDPAALQAIRAVCVRGTALTRWAAPRYAYLR